MASCGSVLGVRPFHWGILSTALINRHLIPRMREGRHRLVAVASRSREKATAYAQVWEIPEAFGSYEEMLQVPGIDGVYVSLPNSLHAEWTIRAVECGKHVLCEKPLATSLAEVEAIRAAAIRHQRVVAEAFMYRHHPQTGQIRALVSEGALGEPRSVRGIFGFWQSRDNDVRLDPALGGGALWDVGCYPISLARFVLGEEPVEAMAWQRLASSGVDDQTAAMLRFPRGTLVHVDCAFRTAYRVGFDVVGTEATLVVANPFRPGTHEKLLLQRGDREEVIDVSGPKPFAGELDDLAAAALDGAAPAVSLDDSLANTRALLACYRSAAIGRPVSCADLQ
jgi:predicted dehydrogenase